LENHSWKIGLNSMSYKQHSGVILLFAKKYERKYKPSPGLFFHAFVEEHETPWFSVGYMSIFPTYLLE